jgi:hypothetical protein
MKMESQQLMELLLKKMDAYQAKLLSILEADRQAK